MDDQKKKDHIDPERPPQRKCPKQLKTYNVPTYDVENTNFTYKGIDLRLANKPWIVPLGTERMPQRISKHRRATLYWSIHSQRGQDETEKFSYCLD